MQRIVGKFFIECAHFETGFDQAAGVFRGEFGMALHAEDVGLDGEHLVGAAKTGSDVRRIGRQLRHLVAVRLRDENARRQ